MFLQESSSLSAEYLERKISHLHFSVLNYVWVLPDADQGTGYFCILSWMAQCISLWRIRPLHKHFLYKFHALFSMHLDLCFSFPNINLINKQTTGFLPQHFLIVHRCPISPLCFLIWLFFSHQMQVPIALTSLISHFFQHHLVSEQLLHLNRHVCI